MYLLRCIQVPLPSFRTTGKVTVAHLDRESFAEDYSIRADHSGLWIKSDGHVLSVGDDVELSGDFEHLLVQRGAQPLRSSEQAVLGLVNLDRDFREPYGHELRACQAANPEEGMR